MSMNKQIDIIRQSITSITRVLSGKGIKVTQSGAEAYVESTAEGIPTLVNIPFIPDNADDKLIAAINGFLDHEVAHILFTKFEQQNQFARGVNERTYAIYNILEDTRIEALMAKKFAGSGKHLATVGQFLIDKCIEPSFFNAVENGGDRNELLSILFVPVIRSWADQEVFSNFMADKWGYVSDLTNKIEKFKPEIVKLKSTKAACDLAILIAKALEEPKPESKPKPEPKSEEPPPEPEQSEQPEQQEEEGESDSNDTSESEASEDDPENESDNEEGNDAKSEGDSDKDDDSNEDQEESDEGDNSDEDSNSDESGEDESESEDEEESNESGDSEEEGNSDEGDDSEEDESESGEEAGGSESMAVAEIDSDSEASDEGSIMLDASKFESDISKLLSKECREAALESDYLIFTQDYDQVEELEVKNLSSEAMTMLDNETRHLVGPLQKTLERLVLSKTKSRNLPGQRSGRVNSASLFKLKTGDTRVFKRKEYTPGKDVAVSLVVDCSGSMNYGDGAMRRITVAMCAAYAMSSVLSRLNIRNEVVGFTTRGRGIPRKYWDDLENAERALGRNFSRTEPLSTVLFKQFNEPLTAEQKRRFAFTAFEADFLRNNVDGESVVIAAKRLLQQSSNGKKMIVLSDGSPLADGINSHICADLKRSVKEIEASGIDVFGIGIQTRDVKDYYKNHQVINDTKDLPNALMNQLKAILL